MGRPPCVPRANASVAQTPGTGRALPVERQASMIGSLPLRARASAAGTGLDRLGGGGAQGAQRVISTFVVCTGVTGASFSVGTAQSAWMTSRGRQSPKTT